MRRRIAVILLLLAAGAIVNVAVAWGLILTMRAQSPTWHDVDQSARSRALETIWPHEFAREPAEVTRLAFWGIDAVIVSADDRRLAHRDRQITYECRSGWPVRSLSYTSVSNGRSNRVYTSTIKVDHPWLGKHWLPLQPVWPGFIVNTLFYALLLWLLLIAPFQARRALRRKRRLCEKCAYPVGVSPVCTECGAAVARPCRVESRV